MPAVVDDNYAIASGGSLHAGMVAAVPAWIPAPGETATINLNTLDSVNPCPANNCWYSQSSKNAAPWRNWTGAALAEGFSTHGAMLYWGGGHGGGEDVGLYCFDMTSGLWSRIGPANPVSDYTETLLDEDWIDYQVGDDYLVPALHTYNYPVYVRPGLPGVGNKGGWLLPLLISSTVHNAPHLIDLESGAMTRYTTNWTDTESGSVYAGVIHDTTRDHIWWGGLGDTTLMHIDLTQSTRTVETHDLDPGQSFAFGGYYARHVYVPEADMAVGFWCPYDELILSGEVFDMSSGAPDHVRSMNSATFGGFEMDGAVGLPGAGTTQGSGFGIDWCPDKQAFYAYEGFGATRVVKFTPSSLDFETCTWTVTTESFSGAVIEDSGGISGGPGSGSQPFSRWRYVQSLLSFVWCDGPSPSGTVTRDSGTRSGLVQLWRPN